MKRVRVLRALESGRLLGALVTGLMVDAFLRRTQPLLVGAGVTLLVALLGHLLPDSLAGTAIGIGFLLATYWLVLRDSKPGAEREHGLALGGVLEPEPLSARRLARATLGALSWAIGLAGLSFPLFWLGYVEWYGAERDFAPSVGWVEGLDHFAAQLSVVALPEEAFYRGYLQSALDRVWRPRFRVLGANVGFGLLLASVVFAIGHVLTEPYLGRLAVFFPSLVFGWLRAKTGGIGAAVAFHAACNTFAWYLGRGYGLISDT